VAALAIWESSCRRTGSPRALTAGTSAVASFATDGVSIVIGHDPRSERLIGQIDLDEAGYAKFAHPSTRTNQPGVFACGDLVDYTYRQAITAAGTGAAAALDAERHLATLHHPTP
jgi:thioredoxin reductase (NADPH)